MTFTPETLIMGLNLLATSGIWLRLGAIMANNRDHKERILRLEKRAFQHD